MTVTALKKVGSGILRSAAVLVGITLVTFLILYLSPKNPAELWLAGSDGNAGIVSEEAIAEQERIMGLDKPFAVQYWNWLKNILRGDMGISYTTNRPVTEEIRSHMEPTVIMAASAVILTAAISIPLGILCAVNKDGMIDNITRFFSFLGISVPSFVISLLLLWVVCIRLGWLPVIAAEGARGLILPVAVLTLQCSAKMTRQVRAIILEELDAPYVEGAVMRGIKRSRILFCHVLKNSLAPIIACVSVYTGTLLGGSAVIESIFSVNGLGRLAVSAAARLDYNVLLGFVLWCAVICLAVNLLADILSAVTDPKVKYGGESR